MNLRMTLATAVAVVAMVGLTACDSGSSADPKPTDSASTAPTEPVDPAAELVGIWEAPSSEWVVHFNDDGTYTEDFRNIVNFRVGRYTVEDDTVELIGDDGNTDVGTKVGVSIEFQLGTLTRK